MSEMIKHLSELMTTIPEFIDPKIHKDHMLWIEMMIMNNLILDLVTGKVLPRIKVYKIWIEFEELYNDISDHDKIIEVYDYYNDLLKYIMLATIEEQLYESTANIQKFIDFK